MKIEDKVVQIVSSTGYDNVQDVIIMVTVEIVLYCLYNEV